MYSFHRVAEDFVLSKIRAFSIAIDKLLNVLEITLNKYECVQTVPILK